MKLLLVEDDELLGDATKAGLIQNGYSIEWVKDGAAALQSLRSESFDILLLDLGLPKISGLEVLHTLRAQHNPIPILILTARDTIEDRVKGLDMGADDYLTKPFDLDELFARLRALQRRFLTKAEGVITHGKIILDPAGRMVTISGEEVSISRREFALFQKMLENSGSVISREQLVQSLYGWGEDVDSNALEVHIHNLRKKFGTDFIRTIRGVGYMIAKEEH